MAGKQFGLQLRYFEDAERSINTLTYIGIAVASLVLICGMSSIASLIVYEIPVGSEYTTWHSYWAVFPAVLLPLLVMAMATAMFRNMKMGAHIFGFYFAIFYLAVLLAHVVVTMVDIFPCESADWWCYNPVTGKVSWRYWWYAASVWGQTLFLAIWLVVYFFLHKYSMEIIDRARSSSSEPLASGKYASTAKPRSTQTLTYETALAKKINETSHICAMDFIGGFGLQKHVD